MAGKDGRQFDFLFQGNMDGIGIKTNNFKVHVKVGLDGAKMA